MKPFFSIRIDYNPADTKEIECCDQNTLRLVIGREYEWDDDRQSTDSAMAIVYKTVEALRWLGNKADFCGEQGFFSSLLSELQIESPDTFFAALGDVAKDWDDEEIEMLEQAKAAAVKAEEKAIDEYLKKGGDA